MIKCTIKDIAKIANVSQATVSSVLNGTGHCSAALEAHIRILMLKHNYTPRPYKGRGKNRKSSQTTKIGFIIDSKDHEVFASPDTSEVIGAAQEILAEKNAEIIPMLFNSKNDIDKQIVSNKIKGIIVYESGGKYIELEENLPDLPLVWMPQEDLLPQGVDAIINNPITFGEWAASEIINNQYKHICCLLPEKENRSHLFSRLILENMLQESNINYSTYNANSSEIDNLFTSDTHEKYDAVIIMELKNYKDLVERANVIEILKDKANLFMSYNQILPKDLPVSFKGLQINFVEMGRALARMMLWRLESPGMPPQTNLVSPYIFQ